MGTVTLPHLTKADNAPNLFSEVKANDQAIIDQVNGNIENANIAASAAIAHSKLANSTAAHLLLANASGVITGTAMSGDATISNSGVVTLAANSVATAEITDANVTDAKLASPNNSVYRELLTAATVLKTDAVASTYLLAGTANVDSSFNFAGAAAAPFLSAVHFDDADYTVASKTQKVRVRAQVWTNATAPAITFTVGLYPATVAGAADTLNITPGVVVAGTTVAIASPSSSSITQGNSGDATIPSDGPYILACVTSGTIANNAAALVTAQLQTRHV